MGLTIVQLAFGNQPYFQYCSAINHAYATKHGYEYLVFGTPSENGTPAIPFVRKSYYKIPAVRDQLLKGNDVMYLDADAYVAVHQRPLSVAIDEYFQEKRIVVMFGENAIDSIRRFSRHQVNTGVFLMRPHDISLRMLDAWWNSYQPDRLNAVTPGLSEQQQWMQLNEQSVFNNFVLPNFRDNINILPAPIFGGMDGQLVRQWFMNEHMERERQIQQDKFNLVNGSQQA